VQQIVRGDPFYWLLYAVLRRQHTLISYPYYTKYAKKGDPTFFRHIDLNIAEAVRSGKGVQMIQGSVSWDDEDNDNCTEVLTCFHRHAAEYQDWRDRHDTFSKGKIEAWNDAIHWPEEVSARFPDVQWRKVPCRRGEVRISHPLLPHGSTGPATKVRRTMLPWYVRVTEDMSTMEVPAMGTYADIAKAHHTLTAAPKTPSGHPNMYGGTNWAFPGDVAPTFASAISRAIHCQSRWDDPAVILECNRVLGSDMTADRFWKWLAGVREEHAAMAMRNWDLCQEIEKEAYGSDPGTGAPDRHWKSGFVGDSDHAAYETDYNPQDVLDRFFMLAAQDPEEREDYY
jgi:hypothetical protein